MLPRRISLGALGALALCAPAAVALAADGPSADADANPVSRAALRAPLGNHWTAASALRAAHRPALLAQRRRLVRSLERLGSPRAARARAADPSGWTAARLGRDVRALRAEVRRLDVPIPPILERIAACESGGDPRAIGGGGTFRGKYQFMQSTWEAVGGSGDPAAAPEAEQDRRAAMLLARSGPGQWPVCSG